MSDYVKELQDKKREIEDLLKIPAEIEVWRTKIRECERRISALEQEIEKI